MNSSWSRLTLPRGLLGLFLIGFGILLIFKCPHMRNVNWLIPPQPIKSLKARLTEQVSNFYVEKGPQVNASKNQYGKGKRAVNSRTRSRT